MKQSLKSKIIYLPKVVIFGLALLNFFYVKSHTLPTIPTGTFYFCFYMPWYETSDISIVWILLAASICLLISNRSSHLIAVVFSGYFTIIDSIRFFSIKMSLLEQWQGIRRYEMDIFLQYEIQWILAAIVFSAAVFYLIRDFTRKKLS